MTIYEASLITFILTVILICVSFDINCYVIDKEQTRKAKLIVLSDGSVWKKQEVEE